MRPILAVSAFAFTLVAGAAFAQNVSGTPDMLPSLSGSETYYTGTRMPDLRTPDDIRASFGALSAEERQAMRDECLSAMAANRMNTMNGAVDPQTTASIRSGRSSMIAGPCQDAHTW